MCQQITTFTVALLLTGLVAFATRTLSSTGRVSDGGDTLLSLVATKHASTHDSNISPPWTIPQGVLESYKKSHSVQALQQECPQLDILNTTSSSVERQCLEHFRRRYAIGFYSCPHQAGNRLHHFMNSMVWAIATNRTLLWMYYDYEACKTFGKGFSSEICNSTGTRESCELSLKLASWIPSFLEWAPKLGLAVADIENVSYWSTHAAKQLRRRLHKHAWHEGDELLGGIDTNHGRILNFGQLLGQDFRALHDKRTRDHLLLTEEARNIATQLLAAGKDYHLAAGFLYGMLFHSAFSFSTAISPVNPEPLNNDEVTFAIHSRHVQLGDDGLNVRREIECMQQALSMNSSRPCHLYVLSDRVAATQRLVKASKETGCSVSTVNHTREDEATSWSVEHGPFAGTGFFRDLALASQARHGLIGGRRSSTLLLEEIILYRKLTEQQHQDDRPYMFCDYTKACACQVMAK